MQFEIILIIVLTVSLLMAIVYILLIKQKNNLFEQRLQAKQQSVEAEFKLQNNSLQQQISFAQQEKNQYLETIAKLQIQQQNLQKEYNNLNVEASRLTERLESWPQLQLDLAANQQQNTQLRQDLAQSKTLLTAERQQWQEKLNLLENAKQQLNLQFKELANQIFEEKSQSFLQQNQHNLGQILTPLNIKINEFQAKVENFYSSEGQQRAGMVEQIKQLMQLNQTLSKDAQSLTQALKGQTKTQGNWGEMILQRVLDLAGFSEGREYTSQRSLQTQEGGRQQPDVIIHLPGERHLVVDAKVSLLAYESYVQAQDSQDLRNQAKKQHIESVKRHIKELAEKKYQKLYELKTVDFVLMFVPIEPAFMLAVTDDNQLFNYAWQNNILLVSPSTLLFVVRTVAHLWRQEAQTANAFDIAKKAANLYDDLVAFVTDLENLGSKLNQAQNAYDGAFKKFTQKRGNIISKVAKLKELGVKPSKDFSVAVQEQSHLEQLTDA